MVAPGSLVASLARIPFFAGLDADALQRVASGARTRRFRRGEVIFHAGDPGDGLFILISGEVKIALPSETGDEAILATLGAGDVFGELALLDGAPRSATATARVAAETVVLPRDRFHALIDSEPAVRDALLASIAGELRRLTTHVEELHFLDMTGRLAARLVRLAEEARVAAPATGSGGSGASEPGSIRLRSSLTQAELASMVGCTRQSVNKLLGQFADDGLVRLDREGMTVTDLSGLVAASRR
jgi:CRP-like cAMP-binding protein